MIASTPGEGFVMGARKGSRRRLVSLPRATVARGRRGSARRRSVPSRWMRTCAIRLVCRVGFCRRWS